MEWHEKTTCDEEHRLINNRQNGRRRGRGGGPRTPNNAPNPGNRQDNRSRGNAVQLHEKYKALARDAQLAGDRVQTEYYLQFADHYFRVLSEGRARFEEQRRSRDDFANDEDEDQDDVLSGAEDGDGEGEEQQDEAPRREQRADRSERTERAADRGEGDQPREFRQRRPRRRRDEAEGQAEANGHAGDEAPQARAEEGGERISADILPPAITVIEGGEETPRAPRRRTRRPRTEDSEAEIAPAA